MSKRTSEANKAVREKWAKEQKLIRKGMGTRDWTPEQQQSILDKGKAYDDDGKAFDGHHMKSVEAYPMYQGDAENIQFLTKAEHRDAHGGSFHYFTNGYYDPKTHSTKKFGVNKYEPCKAIKLSKPVMVNIETGHDTNKSRESSQYKTKETAVGNDDDDDGKINLKLSFKSFLKYFVEYFERYGADVVGEAVGSHLGKTIGEKLIRKSSGNPSTSDSSAFVEYSEPSAERNYPDGRLQPNEHDVSGYTRQQNGKTVPVKPYKRGRNKNQ